MATFKSAYQIASELRTKNAGYIFKAIDGDFTSGNKFEYSDVASAIMDLVAASTDGFVADICKRFNSIDSRSSMSDKQRWCVAYALQKVSDEVVERVINEAKAEIENC